MKPPKLKKEVFKLLKNKNKYFSKVRELTNPQKLTTPETIEKSIINFCLKINPRVKPTFLDVKPELWCRQSCCDLNVQNYINENGGEILCGYKIWYNKPTYIEAERHAVWSKEHQLIDLTFNGDGEDKIVFVPDVQSKCMNLEDNLNKIRRGINYNTTIVIKAMEYLEKRHEIQQMSDEESWKTMLTYKDWLAGKRMDSLILKDNQVTR